MLRTETRPSPAIHNGSMTRPMNVILDPEGDPPRWGQGGAPHPIDDQIIAFRTGPLPDQRQLFYRCARHLYDSQYRTTEADRPDPSNDIQWLTNLATWFGWSRDLFEEVRREAESSAM